MVTRGRVLVVDDDARNIFALTSLLENQEMKVIAATDGRSAMVGELRQQSSVELGWLLPKARCQFCLRGSLLTLPAEEDARESQRHWQALTPSGRTLWGWPQPGAPL